MDSTILADFHEIARELYDFAWGDFCDWYIEIAKTQIAEKPDGQTRNILYSVFEGLVRALHPIMPFVTEELWSQLPKSGDAGTLPSIMSAPYPVADETLLDGQSGHSYVAAHPVRRLHPEHAHDEQGDVRHRH